jgi:hypothetical protein
VVERRTDGGLTQQPFGLHLESANLAGPGKTGSERFDLGVIAGLLGQQ